MSNPLLKVTALRDIGWRCWDPAALNGAEGGWRRSDAADEYDRYMLYVAAGLQSGTPDHALVDYLVGIETEHMRLEETSAARSRAAAAVTAIRLYLGLT